MNEFTTPYTDENLTHVRDIKNDNGVMLGEYRGVKTGELYYFNEQQIKDGIIIDVKFLLTHFESEMKKRKTKSKIMDEIIRVIYSSEKNDQEKINQIKKMIDN